ncbi:Cystathionine beta-synthase [Halotydeus destructor]|nr:Cystathionine beta-synthase [Halotydeus destructor]
MNINSIIDFNKSVDYVLPDTPSKCRWALNCSEPSPHAVVKNTKTKIYDNILSHVGETPLVRLNNIPAEHGVKCEVLVKCEFFNPGGSIKDRIALRMIEEAERDGRIKPGGTLIEPTSGNTGIGLALACAVKGYRCIIVMPQKMSKEKADVIRALGAEVVRTPTSAAFTDPNSNFAVAQKLSRQIPNSCVLDQFRNAGNPLAHYDATADEILENCDKKVDMLVFGAGTGGTATGLGRKFKEVLPACKLVSFDPHGSTLAPGSDNPGFYEVEGVGYDFVPTVLDYSVVDQWIKTNDKESLIMARDLIKKEGLLCGGSSGSAVAAAMKVARDLREDQRCVIVLADGVRNYMTKFLSDDWMVERGFMDPPAAKVEALESKPWFWSLKVGSITQTLGLETIDSNTKCSDAISLMKQRGYDQLPVVDHDKTLLGMVTVAEMMADIAGGELTLDHPAREAITENFPRISRTGTLGQLSAKLKASHYVVVVENLEGTPEEAVSVVGIVTHIDVLNYLMVADQYEH